MRLQGYEKIAGRDRGVGRIARFLQTSVLVENLVPGEVNGQEQPTITK
jgi:hypothetical protein